MNGSVLYAFHRQLSELEIANNYGAKILSWRQLLLNDYYNSIVAWHISNEIVNKFYVYLFNILSKRKYDM